MNKKLVGIIAAVVMAVVGTGVLVLYVQGAEDRALAGEELVRVLTISAPVPAGTPVEQLESLVEPEDVPEKVAPEGVISDLVSVSGLVTATDLVPGEVLLASRFVEEGGAVARTGSVAVPEGLLEVTFAMSQEQFVGGVPVPGNTVALIALGDRGDFVVGGADP
ncbi:MAG TPA: Flp pilus assembly protein CpaB, partial [Acidimicrobiaceae bacterium]|nr:Flp pilus assembly protein CpaB [Acidimicrobiaceae bacterium]